MYRSTWRIFGVGFWMLTFAIAGRAADKPGSQDHPLISRFPGASITAYQVSSFDATHLPIKAFDRKDGDKPTADKVLSVEGKITFINYVLPAGKTMVEVSRNYEQALNAKGFQTLFKCGTDVDPDGCSNMSSYILNSGQVIKMSFGTARFGDGNHYLLAKRRSSQGDIYVLIYAMDGSPQSSYVDLEVVEVQPMSAGQVTVADADALRQSLAREGRAAVYGVYFDTGKADVKPESKPALDEMGKLLKSDRQLKVYIVGHTDNQGTLAANLDLSQRRADAVVKALVGNYQIDSTRLVPKGLASLAPVANNTDERGRGLNRRVELVAQ